MQGAVALLRGAVTIAGEQRPPVSFPLDPSLTAAFDLGDPRARTAVLMLHGFSGSPWEVRPLAESLADRGFFVRAPRLPGHGTTPEAMLFVTWQDWLDAADAAFTSLGTFERVVVAGLSMGALLSVLLAERHGARVSQQVLMAPVMTVRSRSGRWLKRLRPLSRPALQDRWVKKTGTDVEDPDAQAQAPVLARYPLARLFDLFHLQDLVKAAAPTVPTPSLVVGAVHDHVVAFDGVDQLHRSLAASRLLVLQRGFHILPRDVDRARLASEVADFFDA